MTGIQTSSNDSSNSLRPPAMVSMLRATEILDSRGIPTVAVTMVVDGVRTTASVPSGKSTGKHEAVELRDRDPERYGGLGVLRAVRSINDELAPALVDRPLPRQTSLDDALIALDGTPNKERLGANAILAVSLVAARARAHHQHTSLVHSLLDEFGLPRNPPLPVPCFNVINGGAHADNALEFQEFMIVPAGRPTFREALRAGAETYHALSGLLESRGLSTTVGDEGGFAPAIDHPDEALDLLVEAIRKAGYRPGLDIFIAIDPAANSFQREGGYHFSGATYTSSEMVRVYADWLARYPIISIEDGLAEDDFAGWIQLTSSLGGQVQIVGDDLFVSDAMRVRKGAAQAMANAVLLKPNQVGTVTEIVATAHAAREAGFTAMMSHRSGETLDHFIADLAVALGVGQIKAGAPARGERLAKYNRLLTLEDDLGGSARFPGIQAFPRTPGNRAS